MDKYLVNFAAHVDNIEKLSVVKQTLQHFKDNNIDVCFTTHCNLYLNEITPLVKYVCYDSDNTYTTISDYFDNIKLLNDSNCSETTNYWFGADTGYIQINTEPKYSKSALVLFKNGMNIAHINDYKWAIYLEYDIPVPTHGYKNLIESKIQMLTERESHCFYYEAQLYGPILIWPAMVIFDVEKMYNSDTMKSNWYKNIHSWIKYWGNTQFEYALQNCIKTAYGDKIIAYPIEHDTEIVWGTTDFVHLSRSYNLQTNSSPNIYAHVYPHKDVFGKFDFKLFIHNTSVSGQIKDIMVYCDDSVILNITEHTLNTLNWINIPLTTPINFKKIKMTYNTIINNQLVSCSEQFLFEDVEAIHKYVLRWGYFDNH